MKSSALRHIRTIFSVLVLLIFVFIFIDFRGILGEKAFAPILYLQFVPSFLKFVVAGVVSATGFIAVIILTLLTGRSYCSFLCPLGILQDAISRTGGMIRKKFRRYGYKKPYTFLRYFILILTAGIMLLGGVYVLSPDLFSRYNFPASFSFETDLLMVHIRQLKPLAFPTAGFFIDIGLPEDYHRAQNLFNSSAAT